MSDTSTLAEKVNEAMKKTDKRQVGYTVSAYAGVLSALQQAGIVQKENGQQQNGLIAGTAPTYSVSQRSWTVLGNKDINGEDAVENGFFKSELNQAQVSLHSYMSFVVDVVGVDGKVLREHVNCKIKANDHDGKCINSSGGDLQYPPSIFTTNANKSCKDGTIDNGGFVIGVGVAFKQLVINYFKHFYSTSEWNVWDVDKLEKLASQGCLFAEVMIPTSKSKEGMVNAKVIHSKVTVNTNTSSETSSYDVYLPIPLLLLNDFNDICNVEVNIDSDLGSASSVVNNTNIKHVVKFPFSSNKFNHKKSVIEGFTPESVEYYLKSNDSLTVEFSSVNYFSDDDKGRIRLYFDKEREQDVVKEIGEIPDIFKENLFKGVLDEDDYYITNNVVEGFGEISTTVMEYWGNLGAQIGLSAEMVRRAVLAVAIKESGGYWGKWKECTVNGKPDGQGISAGYLQFTQVAGGIKDYRDIYVKKQQTDPSAPVMSQNMYNDIGTYNEQNNAAALKGYENEFIQQSKTNTGQMSQLLAWEGLNGNKIKREATVAWFKKFGCSTAAELKAIFGAVNHLPYYFNDKGFPKWKDLVDKCHTPIEKAIMIEKIHWAGHKDYYGKKSSVQTTNPEEINNNTIGATYMYRYKTIMKLFRGKDADKPDAKPNTDLDGVDKKVGNGKKKFLWWEIL